MRRGGAGSDSADATRSSGGSTADGEVPDAVGSDDPTRTRIGQSPADEQVSSPPASRQPGRLPAPLQYRDRERYQIVAEHGRGGLGRVFRARDKELGRDVALKELLHRGSSDELRFFREALITARLEHPGIVPIHEAGRWPDGTPFYAMKLVAGRPLKELIDECQTLADRLALLPNVIAVADAVAYAHDRRIIHRDLKPSNVIVGEFGETVVIDWGLAKVLDAADEASGTDDLDLDTGDDRAPPARDAGVTVVGTILGTPAYMAPEQARGEAVDERADVYAIGAILHLLCTGKMIAPGATDATLLAALRASHVDPDLAVIAARSCARAASERYPSARALAKDLHAFTAGARISRNYSLPALLAHWFRRNRRTALTALAVMVFVAAGAGWMFERTVADRDRVRSALVEARDARAVAETNGRAAEDRTTQLYVEHGRRALLDDDGHRAYIYLRAAQRRGASGPALDTMLGRAGRLVLAERASAQASAGVQVVAWRPDGQVFASGNQDGTVEIWSATGERLAILRGHTEFVWNLTWTPDGSRLISSGRDNVPRLWDPARGTLLAELRGHQVAEGEFGRGIPSQVISTDGLRLATSSNGGDAWLWDVATGAPVTRLGGHEGSVLAVALSADGATAVTADAFAVRIWNLASPGRAHRIIREPTGAVRCATFAPGGFVVTFAAAGPVRVIEPRTGLVVRTLAAHASERCPVVSDDLVITVGAGDELRAWGLDGTRRWETATGLEISAVTVKGDRVAVGTENGRLRVWDRSSGRPIVVAPAFRHKIWAVALAPDAASIVAGDLDGMLRVYATAGVDELSRHDGLAFMVRFGPRDEIQALSPDGVHIGGRQVALAIEDAALTEDGRVLVLGTDGRVRLHGPAGDDRGGPVAADVILVAITGDGRLAAMAHADNTLSLWEVEGWRRRAVLRGHTDKSTALAFDKPGDWLASGSDDGTARVWSTEQGTPSATLRGHNGQVMAVRFMPDGDLVTGGSDRTARIWALPAGTLRTTFADHRGAVFHVEPSPDGTRLAAAGEGGVYVWSADGALLARPLVTDLTYAVTWDAQGTRLVAASRGNLRDGKGAAMTVLDVSPLKHEDAPAVECRLRVALNAEGRLEERTPDPCPPAGGLRNGLHNPPATLHNPPATLRDPDVDASPTAHDGVR